MTKEQIRTAFTYHPIYQALTRSSARVAGDENPKTFVVPDRSTAEWLADVFQGARMLPLSLSVVEQPERKRGRQRKYASDAEKQAAYRARKQSPS